MPANAPKVLLRSDQSGGALSVIELTGSATPPLHRHDFDETFYVLEGELTFQLGDELVTRQEGKLAFAPRGGPQHLRQPERRQRPRPARLHPAGFERYFDRIAAHITGVESPPEAAKPIPEVITLGPRSGNAVRPDTRATTSRRIAVVPGQPQPRRAGGAEGLVDRAARQTPPGCHSRSCRTATAAPVGQPPGTQTLLQPEVDQAGAGCR
jgi:hypothetical protein